MESIKELMQDIKTIDSYQRIDPLHPIGWYIGLDSMGNYSLFCVTPTQPHNLISTQIIQVFIGIRRDGKFGITFSLKEKTYINVFVHFCEDMIESTKLVIDPSKAADAVCGRYIQWQKAFKKTRGDLLGFEVIKGLIGELIFLRDKMIPTYGAKNGLRGWSGIDFTDRDFTYEDTWYEVKTTVSGGSSVKISSVEQLDIVNNGHLVVVYLDKTSKEDTGRITLNNLTDMITQELNSVVLQEEFKTRLLEFGYYSDEAYDDICFSYKGMSIYKVTQDFPCLRQKSVPAAVTDVEYRLSLPAIDFYREDQ